MDKKNGKQLVYMYINVFFCNIIELIKEKREMVINGGSIHKLVISVQNTL